MQNYRDGIIKNLSQLIAFRSVEGNREELKGALDYVLCLGREMGFKADSFAGGRVGVIEWGEGTETLGILAHVDVVPPEPIEKWSTDPYEAVVKDGTIYGLGTLDDKGMVITCLYAMKAAADKAEREGMIPKKKVQLIIGTQEESEWSDMYEYVKNNPLPDYGFTPDGEFPYANIEKGIADVELIFDLLQSEKGAGEILSIEAGSAVNAIPAFAKAVMGDGRIIEATGKTCHSCDPTKGDNAIFGLLEKLREEKAGKSVFTDVLEMLKEKFEDCYGGTLPIYRESEYYEGEWVHRNVFSPTQIWTENNQLHVMVDVRFSYGTEADEIVSCLDELARELDGRAVASEILPAVFVSRNRPFLKAFDEAYDKYSGLPYSGSIAMGGSYAKTMPNVVSWGPVFPGDEDFCHEPNEHISIDTIEKCFKIYECAIETILFSDRSYK